MIAFGLFSEAASRSSKLQNRLVTFAATAGGAPPARLPKLASFPGVIPVAMLATHCATKDCAQSTLFSCCHGRPTYDMIQYVIFTGPSPYNLMRCVMTPTELDRLLEQSRSLPMTEKQQEKQRISFAYGNTHFENDRITKEMVTREAASLRDQPDEREATD